MDYRVYIYKSSAVTASAIAIHQLNLAVSTKSLLSWRESTSRFMCAFDIDRISERIRALVGERCRIHTLKPPVGYGDIEFLCVETSYKNAASVLPYIHCVTAENDLVLYDAETEKVFYRELINRTFITAKSRVEDYTNAILSEMNPVCSIHMISAEIGERDCEYSYVVTLRKGSQESFRKRCEEFYECLRKNLLPDEDLYTGKKCFTISGDYYSIRFCLEFSLEGGKKHPNVMGYYHKGRPKVKLTGRMGCEDGLRYLSEALIDPERVRERMALNELVSAYPNPADRFIASVNITKWEQSQPYVKYSVIGAYGAEIIFHVVPKEIYDEEKHISMLSVDEDEAGPILKIIEKFYPYFRNRYYLEPNHLPIEMWTKIVESAKEERRLCLEKENFSDAELLDIFIKWSDAQLDEYITTGDGRMFNVQGP